MMSNAPLTQHYTFSIERVYDAPRERVFSAWANAGEKAKWFAGKQGQWTPLIREMDFRRGGRERAKGQWADGDTSDFQATYHDIRENERIVYYYDMHVNERRISASLTTVEFEPDGSKTRMTFTEHVVYLDGWLTPEDREAGSILLLENLDAYLLSTKATV
jgi:uncharacterized protein YndB with AHSA1/START domain